MRRRRLAILFWPVLCCACGPSGAPDVTDDPSLRPADDVPIVAPADDDLKVDLGEDLALEIGELLEVEALLESADDGGRLFFTWSYSLDLSGQSDPQPIDESLAGRESVLQLDPADLFDTPDVTFILQVGVLQILDGVANQATDRVFVIVGDGPDPAVAAALTSELSVSLGSNLAGDPGDLFEIEATVTGALPSSRLFYSWDYLLLGEGQSQVIASSGFALDDDGVRIDPLELFSPSELAAGLTFVVRVRVFEIGPAKVREASDKTFITVGDGPLPPLDPVPDDTDDDGASNDNDNTNDNGNANANDNDNANDNGGGNDNTNDNGGCNANDNSSPDPCSGVSALTVILPTTMHLSLFEGTQRIEPTVCGGTPPYTYDWTPVDHLEDTGPLEATSAQITTVDIDFTPPATGDYPITLTVQDAASDSASDTVTIKVNDFDPLIALAGEDRVVTQNSALSFAGSALGGSGSYGYLWFPSCATSSILSPATAAVGDTTYTLTVTDGITGIQASDTMRVVVTAAGSSACSPNDVNLAIQSAQIVAYDPTFGSRGQAIVVSANNVLLYDLGGGALRTTLVLPAEIQDIAVDAARRRAFATTRLSGQFTRSVQVIDLDAATLGTNIGLTNKVAAARGLAVVPSSGKVLVAISGAANGLMQIDPAGGTLDAALQNIHHPGSFEQPIDVAVLESGGLSVAAVVNASSATLTLVPLASITLTPDVAGGGGGALPRITLDGVGRAITAHAPGGQVIVGWNSGTEGYLQRVSITSNSAGSGGSSTGLAAAIADLGLDVNLTRRQAYAAMGTNGVAVLNLDFDVFESTLNGTPSAALSVAATAQDSVLIVGQGSNVSERCP